MNGNGDRNGSEGFSALRRLCEEAVEAEVIPGAVVLVADEGEIRFHEAFGHRQIEPHRLPAREDTVYDVASLTKAVVTSVLVMRAVAAGKLALDDRAAAHLPELAGPGKDAITVRHLLAHASGLPAHRPFYQQVTGEPSARLAIELGAAREPLLHPAGTRSLYSDLGFIVLGWLLERVTGERLDVLFADAVAGPLGLGATTFVNLADSDARAQLLATRSVAATERCPVRDRVILGEVHDLNAYAMGGIAGHAGLFSTATDLGRLAGALVAAWRGEARDPLLGPDEMRQLWSGAGIPGSTWRLGWDGPAATGSQAGERLSRQAVGHLGYTGSALWIDPRRARFIVTLTNRIHPAVKDDGRFRAFRPAVNDAAIAGLDG
jgi:CubicO group peptidase (beta-lactamase class C family)